MRDRSESAMTKNFHILFEIAIGSEKAESTEHMDITERVSQFAPDAKNAGSLTATTTDYGKGWPLVVTAEPRLSAKAKIFPQSVLVVDLDSARQLIDPEYYNGSADNMLQGNHSFVV